MNKKLEKFIARYRGDRGGNMIMMTAGSLSVFMMCGAIVSDLSVWKSQQAKLQDAADSAALSGAIMLSAPVKQSGNSSNLGLHLGQIKKIVIKTATDMVYGENDHSLDGFTTKVKVFPKTETVTVDLAVGVPRLFSAMFLKTDPTVSARAVATVVYREDPNCIYVLDAQSDDAVKVAGQGSLLAPGCGMQIHSTSASALRQVGSGNLMTDKICIAGSYSGSGFYPTPETNCTVDPDPFAYLQIPTGGSCDHTDFKASDSGTLRPGTYCGGMDIGAGYTMSLTPGTYFIRDGVLKLTSGASILGTGVVFVLEGTGSLHVNSDGRFEISPPTKGDLKGFSFVQSRTASHSEKGKLSGTGSIDISGTFYTPFLDLEITGKAAGNSNTPSYGALVVGLLKVAGQGDLNVGHTGLDAEPKETVRLVE